MRKPASFYFFKRKPIVLKDRYERWRDVADLLGFTTRERLRVEWMVFYYTTAEEESAALTAEHFGIPRKTFYKWSKRFRNSKYDVHSLADRSRAPHRKRHWKVTLIQEERIRRLRKRYPYYGKKKLKVIYEREERLCFLFQLDTIVIYWNSLKKYILTAVDHASKLGYARMYKNKSSRSAADFLYRLRYLVDQPIENLPTDNGSEFTWDFARATAKLGIQRYFSSPGSKPQGITLR